MSYNGWAGFNESVSAVTATPSVEPGVRQWSGSKEYVYMYNGGGEAAPKRVVHVTGTSGYTFVVTFATGAAIHASPFGVVQNATIPAGSYGWVATRGHVDLYNDGTASVAAGDIIICGTNGVVHQATAATVITQVVWGGIVGKATQATDTAGTFGAYIRLG